MEYPINTLPAGEFPKGLLEIPQPPKSLNYRGTLPTPDLKLLAVVGSRKYSSYGKQAVEELIGGLMGYAVGIVSGLALGIDSLAHETALRHDLYTLAIPGGGLADNSIYPRNHKALAHRILEAGGGLMSEYAPDFKATNWSFPQRNRLVAGLCPATLLVEAAEKSGTLITARMTVDYNRDLMAVPGNIFSANSVGTNQFIKLGATPVTCSKDIVEILTPARLTPTQTDTPITLSPAEKHIYELLKDPVHKDELIRQTASPTTETNQLLMMMEIKGLIIAEQNIYRRPLN